MAKVQLDAAGLKNLADAARRAETLDGFADLAVEWAEGAEAYVKQLQDEINELRSRALPPGLVERIRALLDPESRVLKGAISTTDLLRDILEHVRPEEGE